MALRMRTEDEIKAYIEGFDYCYRMFCEYLEKSKEIDKACEKMYAIRCAVSSAAITEGK